MTDSAVVTVGTLQAGTSENVIPDRALLRLNVRTFKDQVRERVLSAIRRILDAEAAGLGRPKPPDYSVLSEFPLTVNDEAATGGGGALNATSAAGAPRSSPPRRARISACSCPPGTCPRCSGWSAASTRRIRGGRTGRPLNELRPTTPLTSRRWIDPTLRTGVEAMLAAAAAWLVPAQRPSPDPR